MGTHGSDMGTHGSDMGAHFLMGLAVFSLANMTFSMFFFHSVANFTYREYHSSHIRNASF